MSNSKPTVLITGASKGIGRDIAVNLAKSGKYKLALLSRNKYKLQETAELCKNEDVGIAIKIFQTDVTDKDSLKSSIDKCALEFGPLSVVINNAGILYINEVDKNMDMKKVEDSINVNLTAAINGCIFSVPYLKETKKLYPNYQVAIINIASRASVLTWKGFGIYCATKFGIRGFSDCLFKELKDDATGIKVCSIMPGSVNTEMLKDDPEYKDYDLNKIIQPRDISYTVDYVLNCPDTFCPTEILISPQYPMYKAKL